MEPSRDQVVHDLAMACVNGAIQAKVLADAKEEYPCVTPTDLAFEAILAYKDAYGMIDSQIVITDSDD